MINPCNSNQRYIQFNPLFNLPTHYGNRVTDPYVKPTPEMFAKHKLLLLKHTTRTNGPGILNKSNATRQIAYRLGVDSIQYKNRIYKIPCRFKEYIPIIKLLIDQGVPIQKILQDLIDKYDIQDISLKNSSYQNKRLYKYPFVNVNSLKQNPNAVSNSAPFKIGESLSILDKYSTVINNNIDFFNFPIPQYCNIIYVSNNDGKSYTTKFSDLLPNGSASFFGSSLLNNLETYDLKQWQLYVFILPQDQTQVVSYGYIFDSSKYEIEKEGLIFMPVHTYESLVTYTKYPIDMPFSIKINNKYTINDYQIPCKFKQYELTLENTNTVT